MVTNVTTLHVLLFVIFVTIRYWYPVKVKNISNPPNDKYQVTMTGGSLLKMTFWRYIWLDGVITSTIIGTVLDYYWN